MDRRSDTKVGHQRRRTARAGGGAARRKGCRFHAGVRADEPESTHSQRVPCCESTVGSVDRPEMPASAETALFAAGGHRRLMRRSGRVCDASRTILWRARGGTMRPGVTRSREPRNRHLGATSAPRSRAGLPRIACAMVDPPFYCRWISFHSA
jgi:hypothetical protein